MIKVLQILDNITAGGIQSFVMNVYRNVDRNEVQFDFLVHHKYEKSYEEEIKSLGGSVYYLPSRRNGVVKNRIQLNDFFKKNATKYNAAHFHESSLSYLEPLEYAKKYHIPVRIMHSHNTKVPKSMISKFFHSLNKYRIVNIATDFVACGQMAGEWMFGETAARDKVNVVYNGIEISRFTYDEKKRKKIRLELDLEGKFVIGHVGRFEPVKNHTFLLDLFVEILKKEPSAILVLVGNGKTFDEIKQRANKLKIQDSVRFLGIRDDVDLLYQGFDALVLPSLYEGFPVTAIEAEASGLPCTLADTITKEAKLKDNVFYLSLDEEKSVWVEHILANRKRLTDNQILMERNFDITSTVEILKNLYQGKGKRLN